MSDYAGLKAEVEAMGNSLLADPNTSPQVRAFLHMWKAVSLLPAGESAKPAIRRSFASEASSSDSKPRRTVRRHTDPNRDLILNEAASVLQMIGEQMRTAEIYECMGPIKEKIGGSEPKSNLSAMMHHSPLFNSHGRSGWTLAGPQSSGVGFDDVSEITLDVLEEEAIG